ncbi:adenosine receptor A2b-like [Actinia tenebrosa]|uniref:Adenosine receptor A2b-like n=1 Tax=Actinia tenebrosa TaxID=6105 RepID=A0A6P8IGC3_ACTTE|nr:adenosine receptor A2b-like [Actinia tenebrosa]XP_031565758.1 adenosine receptor A2b-like [Actinia tenebrosa]XP_031565759.1 adenosine receptor A2b-like [Actinia tenebrosa]XP_031565760.1 adenosine receptor A2b-like [Actinia tenebrosa]XP_031565761.1 adenosine receptor A2b-like [Actinia tenebrosa]
MDLRSNFNDSSTNETSIPQPFNHPMWTAVQAGLWSCLTVLSVTGNVITLMCICRGAKRLQSSMYAFYASLATSDCLVGMFCTPLLMVSTMHQDWILGDEICHAYSAFLSVSLNASIATLCLISLDRLNAVKHPFDYRSYDTYTQRFTKLLLSIAWLYSIFWGVAPLVGWGEIVRDSVTFTCKPNWGAEDILNKSYSFFLALFAFALPVITMVVVYCLIYHYSRKCAQWMKVYEGHQDKTRENIRLLRERAVFKTVLVILGVFASCWAVYTLTTFCKLFISRTPPNWFIQLGLILALTGSCTNPLIYAVRDKKLVREFFSLPFVRPCLCMKEETNSGSRDLLAYTSNMYRLTVLNSKETLDRSPAASKETLYKIPELIIPLQDKQTIVPVRITHIEVKIRTDLTKDMLDNMSETDL